jgi:hypothetical protein
MKKRYRRVDAKPGELKIRYGTDGNGERDIVYAWGDGVPKGDSWLLHSFFGWARTRPSMDSMDGYVTDPSLLEELNARGYDITTLKFSIQKKQAE